MLSLSKDKIRILLLEGIDASAVEHFARAGYANVDCIRGTLPPDELAERLADTHFVGIRSRTKLTADILAAAPRLAGVGCFCIGTDQVDTAAARTLGIPVFNAPYGNTRSVAELVLAEIILLLRGIPARNAAAHRGEWQKSADGAHEVRGKTLGIVGYGHIGMQLGVLAEGLGMHVAYFDTAPRLPLGNARACTSLEEVLGAAHVVTLHVPDTPSTRGMIGAVEMARMRPGSHLVNASRGGVVDIPALAEALRRGHVAGAAVDVFPKEPATTQERFTSELQGMDNVLLTPHIGGSTHEAQQNIAADVAIKLIQYSDNGSTVGAVNFPEVSLPDHVSARRILHIHRNEPGVLTAVNRVLAANHVNIAGQYLQTMPDVGYVVMDVETDDVSPLLVGLGALEATIRTRWLR
ncbi:MAG: phosphoglycerate dehydrogenase [Rhodothermales bacterium]